MVRVRSTAAVEEAPNAAATTTPDSSAHARHEEVQDTQPPAAMDSETDDVDARKAAAQESLAEPRTEDAMGMGESDVDAADPPVNPATEGDATESSTQPHAEDDAFNDWKVEESLSKEPRDVAVNEPDLPLDGEEEFSLAGDESSPSTTQPVAAEEPIAVAHPLTEKPAQKPHDEATAAPTPSHMPVTVEDVATRPPAITPVPVTTKPSLRTDAAAVVSDSSTLHSRLNQGNPLLLISFAVICCGFLILWARKRKINSTGGSLDGGSSSGSGGSSKVASKAQYSRIENKKESPFEEDDDVDDDDDRGDNWDDWEGGDMGRLSDEPHVSTNAYQSSLYAHPNPFAASMVSPPESPELVAQSAPPQFQFAAPPRLAAPGVHDQPPTPDYLSEIVMSTGATVITSDAQKATSPGSNSSSDSYEVVTDDPALLHSSPFASSKKSPPKPAEDADKQAEDDLFSQFGMVPTFKKSAQPSSFLQTPLESSSGFSHRQQPPAVVVAAAPVSAAAASALFAAEMEDFSVATASDEWGEDDEWVQGL